MTDMPGARRLPRSTPEQQGVSSSAVLALLDAITELGELHSLMVVRHGHVVAEGWAAPYSSDRVHLLYSLSKSFTSTAVGFAQAEGLLDVDDLVLEHLADLAPASPDANLRRMRLRHLLTMTTGHDEDASDRSFSQDDWARAFLALPVEHEPGTHFVYNTAATYILSAIVQRITGQRVLDYLRPRLLEPLGIEGATFEQSPQGIDTGGFGMSVTTEDIAVFGQLYLQDGVWSGTQVLPVGWAAEATARQVPNGDDADSDWAQGYGYQFWRGRHGSYRGDGAFGQYCVVVPELDLVVVTTSAIMDMHRELALVWEHLLPGVGEVRALDGAAHAALVARLEAWALPIPVAGAASDVLDGRTVEFEANPWTVRSASWTSGDDADAIELRWDGGQARFDVGHGGWRSGVMRLGEAVDVELLAAGAWLTPTSYELRVQLPAQPHGVTLRVDVDGSAVTVEGEINAAFAERHIRLVGSL